MFASMSEIASMLVTHRKASIDEIERAWHGDVQTLLKWVGSLERVEECAVLKTCNRVEIYVVSARGEKVLFDLAKKARVSSRIIDFHDHDESLLHLLRLASGLESMIIGEDQILGQMKELVQIAAKAGTTGWMLDTAFKKAIAVGKRVRKETQINERSVSVGSAAVDLAQEILGDLKGSVRSGDWRRGDGGADIPGPLGQGYRLAGGHQQDLQLSPVPGRVLGCFCYSL